MNPSSSRVGIGELLILNVLIFREDFKVDDMDKFFSIFFRNELNDEGS